MCQTRLLNGTEAGIFLRSVRKGLILFPYVHKYVSAYVNLIRNARAKQKRPRKTAAVKPQPENLVVNAAKLSSTQLSCSEGHYRKIWVIRHAHRHKNQFDRRLTDHGHQQAREGAQMLLAEMTVRNLNVSELVSSKMHRAIETAGYFHQTLLKHSVVCWHRDEHLDELNETQDFQAILQRAEAAYREYFENPQRLKGNNLILVCHGKIMRYFINRTVMDPEDALRNLLKSKKRGMEIPHLGCVEFSVDEEQNVKYWPAKALCHPRNLSIANFDGPYDL